MTTTRQTKAETITRTITVNVHEDFDSRFVIAVVLEKHMGGKTTKCTADAYELTRLSTHFGVGVHVEQKGSNAKAESSYDVLLNAPGGGHTCDCKWGSYKGHVKPCRHIEMALQAVRERKI